MDPFTFPIAGTSIIPLYPLLVGIFGGIVSALLGIGAGAIITPFLIFLGIPPLISISSQLGNAIGTSFAGFLAYFSKRNVDIALSVYLFIGGGVGAISEFFFLEHFKDHAKILAATVLSLLPFLMLKHAKNDVNTSQKSIPGASMRHWMLYLPFHRIFIRTRVELSLLIPICVGLLTGIWTSSLGGSTSVFIIPILTCIIGRMNTTLAGTALLAGTGINIIIMVLHALSGYPCDFLLLLLLVMGGNIGTFLGMLIARFISMRIVAIASALFMLFISLKFWIEIFSPPKCFSCPVKVTSTIDWIIPIVNFAHERVLEYTILCLILIIIVSIIMKKIISFFLPD